MACGHTLEDYLDITRHRRAHSNTGGPTLVQTELSYIREVAAEHEPVSEPASTGLLWFPLQVTA